MRTPRELDHLREQAIPLHRQGEPPPPDQAGRGHAETKARAAAGVRRYWDAERPARETARAAISAAAAAQLGELTDREIMIAGAIAYWCEGTKSKPYRMDQQVRFINSDPALIRLFLAFLDRAGVSRQRLRFCVHIHESADVEAATRYWARVTGAALDQFVRPVIKHHTPRRPRPSGNADYHGCLRVSVIKSSTLYREISGWAHGVMTARRRDPV